MPNPIRYVSLLKQALKDRWGTGAYIDDVLKTTRKKKWGELTDREQGAYEALESLYSANDDLRMYERQLFYALRDDELFKAFKSGKLDGAFAGKILDKKINTMLDDYIKRIENMIKTNEKYSGGEGYYHRGSMRGSTSEPYTADDIHAVYQEMMEEALPELMQEGKSLNMLVYPHGGSIDDAGRLDVIAGALDAFEDSRALQNTWQEAQAAATRVDPILFNLRRLKTHLDDLPEEQLAWTKTRGTADDLDFADGEDATSFADWDKNDWGLNRDRMYAAADNVAPEGRYVPTKPANFDFVMEGDVWPLPRKAGKTPKFEVEDIVGGGKGVDETGYVYVERLHAERAAAEQQVMRGESMQKVDLSVEDNQEGAAIVEKAKAAIKRIQEELDAYLGITKKQGGGLIDSPLYLRDY
jgi:hypothetical protein